MNQILADLLKILELERLEINLFRGESRDIGSPQVFGGQVLGQALMAATSTVDADRLVHSLHAYFLRAGDFNKPIVYEVDRSRDGGSFTSRRVVAIQDGQQIFHMSASFQVHEENLDHQVPMPKVPPPESVKDVRDWLATMSNQIPQGMHKVMMRDRPFEFRSVHLPGFFGKGPRPQILEQWFKAVDRVPDGEALHRCLLAYASDYYLLSACTLPHDIMLEAANMRVASIDHAMWFHRPVRVDDWLLYVVDSPSASGARGLARGSIFNRKGELVASTAQEGLFRKLTPKPPQNP
ncbi:MAG TPA: acyl-CoA thioesterase II [Steroidobacteraceae bacterium]|nr:acyl-CoA thioesterase II [Steroidobacteraceae bacterium]